MAHRLTARPGSPFTATHWRQSSFQLPFRRNSNSADSGFALVAVVWSLGLISLLAAAVVVGARYRTKVASSEASVTTAAAAAESAVNFAIALSLTGTVAQNVKFPLKCQMPGGERVNISLEEETGKVDLNTATAEVLARLFTALAGDQSAGMRISASIVEFRDPTHAPANDQNAQTNKDKSSDRKTPRFETIMQLDQIHGISPALFRKALRFVTVRSGRPEPDKDAASPALRRLLNLDQTQPAPVRAPPAIGNVTIRADVSAVDGTRFIREALVSLGSEGGRPFRIREWRRADIEFGEHGVDGQPKYVTGHAPVDCLGIGKAARG